MIMIVDNSYGDDDDGGEDYISPGDGCCKLPPRTKQLNSHL